MRRSIAMRWLTLGLLVASCSDAGRAPVALPGNAAAAVERRGSAIGAARLLGPFADLAAYCARPDADDACGRDGRDAGCGRGQRWRASAGGPSLAVTPPIGIAEDAAQVVVHNRDGWYAAPLPFGCNDRVGSELSPLTAIADGGGGWIVSIRSRRRALWHDGEDAGLAVMEGLTLCHVAAVGPPACTRDLPLAWADQDVDARADTPPPWGWRIALEVAADASVVGTRAAGTDELPTEHPFVRGRLCPGPPIGRTDPPPRCEAPADLLGLHALRFP